ncbi:MAG: ArsB/NhaD family transporter [Armatimonadota bacterium]
MDFLKNAQTLNYIVSVFIFFTAFVVIFSEKIHRTIVALAGAMLMLLVGKLMGFYNEHHALSSIDFNTLGLLLGMMILLALLKETGVLEFIAIWVAQRTKGSPWRLMVMLGLVTSVLSMFLDNVTTVILIAPITVFIAQKIKINPVPLLLSEALLSNIGGVSTLVGDPPNILIGTAANISFNAFLIYLGPIVAVTWIISMFLLKKIFKQDLKAKPDLEELMKMNPREALKDNAKLKRTLFCLFLVIILFFLHSSWHLSPSFVAFFGAALALILVRPKNLDEILNDVEWGVLIFFAALFVIVGGLEASGVLKLLGNSILGYAESNLLLTTIIMLWGASIISALVDNIPFTMAVIPLIQYMGSQGINIAPLWWALALGAGFGGNGTPIGATANVVVINLSEKIGKPITFKKWIQSGAIITLISCILATLWMILLFKLMKW